MKYIIQVELDPETGSALESQPEKIQEIVGAWQALNPIGYYFSLTRRAMTIILEAPNEDAFFEALHATWVATNDYPDVSPVVSAEEFPAIIQRLGIGG
ncbi:MAG: hypothetical protein U1C74_00265 [Phenylobacterium sp.]|nr:hypothetical protein [Phenylobacterium sp.]